VTAAIRALGTAIRPGHGRSCHETPPLTADNMFATNGFSMGSDWGTSTAEPSPEGGP
jgi:hypothetical protein